MVSTITKRHGTVECKPIPRQVGKQIIIDNHYSHKNVNTSTIYLGCYVNNDLIGVASLGCAMNPIPTTKLVTGSSLSDYLELNRLWISDAVQDNIETVFLGLCFKWLKQNTTCKWIQSFADGRLGVGTIYQASNFLYCGYHNSKFWQDTDGQVYHNSILTRKTRKKYHELMPRLHELTPFTVKTYRYIYFLDRKWIPRLRLKTLPYPKNK